MQQRSDGSTRVRPGRLFVKEEDPLTVVTDGTTLYKHPFRLFIFLDDQVIQVGSHVRSNSSSSSPRNTGRIAASRFPTGRSIKHG